MKMKVVIFFLATIVATCHAANFRIFPLQMKTGLGAHYPPKISCASWRLGVEAHNLIGFTTIPKECEEFNGEYMLSEQYRSDSKTVNREAYYYARDLEIASNDIWVFDVDETAISNLPYYAEHGFGVEPFNSTAIDEWIELGELPVLPETIKLYNKLLSLNIKIVFLTERSLVHEKITAENLKKAGYYTWEKLIVKDKSIYAGKTSQEYKTAERKKLVEEGYRIIGNTGDQWTDLLGKHKGDRTFKLPNPMFYIP
ncbi:stem 28 kDa glycoprotein-like [Gastrolobium bilobum]|uniref:stem 28 kDa glycoprotein-like n=1 Tax=Gastrolobium bilobum TaxID=150636 RepID=UPI002AB2D633|nr:stem 28 kDa glycoprotein-like [Gastrolobium bilobum]